MPSDGALSLLERKITPEDAARAQVYGLLSGFLASPPDAAKLRSGAGLSGDMSALGQAISGFAEICARLDPETVADEYHELFIGVGRGELVPFGSYYLTGFLNEKPLAKLRQDMTRMGIERVGDTRDPEDHIASVCEIMAGLIDGRFGPPDDGAAQKQFFERHLNAWAPYFFRDLEAANSSVLYATLAVVGRVFLEIEETAFRMA